MTIGFKPKGENGPPYHPERDYAYITPTLMRTAIERMDADDLSSDVKEWKEQNSITAGEIAAVAEALGRAQRDFVRATDPVTSFEQALNRRDFYESRLSVRQLLFAAIGEVFCAAWFVAVRDVSKLGEPSLAEKETAEFTAAVHKFVTKAVPGTYKPDAAVLQLRNDVLETRCAMLRQECRALRQELQELKKPEPTIVPDVETISFYGKLLKKLLALVAK